MKRIYLLYFGGFLASIFLGGVVSIAYRYSWWFLLLLAFPISFGYVLLSELFLRINAVNIKKVIIFTVVALLVVVGIFTLLSYYRLDEKSLYGMTSIIGGISYMIGLMLIGIRLINKWEEKKKNENENSYLC